MFENPRRGRQARNFATNVPKILDLKYSSEKILSENWRWVPLHLLLHFSRPLQEHPTVERFQIRQRCLRWALTRKGGGRYMFPWSHNAFLCYLLFPINKTNCSLKWFKLRFPWSQKLFAGIVSHICLLDSWKTAFEPPLSSAWNPLMQCFIGCSFCHLNCLSCLCNSDDFIGIYVEAHQGEE